MQAVLFDTSVYITALRHKNDPAWELRALAAGRAIWLSAVVLEELYAGTDRRNLYIVERLERDFFLARRILLPTLADWTQTGRVLSLLAAKYDYEQIGRGRLTNDALMAMSARRLAISVLTANARDFARLAEFRPFQWQVVNIR